MRNQRRGLIFILLLLLLCTNSACTSASNQAVQSAETSSPQSQYTFDQAQVTILTVTLSQAYSTYYLMTFSGPDDIFLVIEMDISGVEDPVAWGEINFSLTADDETYPLEQSRPILTNEEIEYRADFDFTYAYEWIYRLPRQADFENLQLVYDDRSKLNLAPFLADQLSQGVANLYQTFEPAGSALSGVDNLAMGEQSVIAGGSNNQTLAINSAVCGGSYNLAAVSHAFVGGGRENRAELFYATIGGGYANLASARETTVCGGSRNQATDRYATVAGGIQNLASAQETVISGGSFNLAGDVYAAVAGGTRNQASGYGSFVGAGAGNVASADYSLVGGGLGNQAAGEYSTVAGGRSNQTSGNYSAVLGGSSNLAGADYSLALGSNVNIAPEHLGAILMADGSGLPFASQASNEFAVRATGGVRLVTSVAQDGADLSGALLPSGSGSWAQLSNRESKTDILAVDPQAILEALLQIPLASWRYASQDPSVRHIGPMAQDFYAAFGFGEDQRYINSIDADGVALAAIQALAAQVEQQAQDLQSLEARLQSTSRVQSPLTWGLIFLAGLISGWVLLEARTRRFEYRRGSR